jgi:hypothetical protein
MVEHMCYDILTQDMNVLRRICDIADHLHIQDFTAGNGSDIAKRWRSCTSALHTLPK